MKPFQIISLNGVDVAYSGSDRPAIQDINLDIPSRKLVLITGPNGAGKTTLVETCLGLLKPLKGEAYLFGVNTKSRRIRDARRRCSYVPQDFMKPPFEAYTVKRVIQLGLAPFKSVFESPSSHEDKLIEEVARLLEIEDLLDKPIGALSGGQQQRVVIARAIARKPRVLFLDEPFSSLDKEGRELISRVAEEYVEREGGTVIMVSHDINPIIGYADVVVKMDDGRIVDKL